MDATQNNFNRMQKLKTNRGWFKLWFLTFITCGIYPFFFYHRFAKDINLVCEEDGRKTAGLGKLILFTLITFGVYGIIWMWKTANRIRAYGVRHNVPVKTSGAKYFLWCTVGNLLFGLGPIIGLHKYLKSMNKICKDAIARENAAKIQAELDAKRAIEEAKRAEEAAKRAAEEEAKRAEEAKREEERAAAQAAAQAAAIAAAVAQAMAAVQAQAPAAAPAAPAAEEAPAEEAPAAAPETAE